MNVKEVAHKWHCTERWITERCKEGMIPLAEKKGRKWIISEDADKPPCTRNHAVLLLASIFQSGKGIDVNLYPGNKETCLESYKYLSTWCYISQVNPEEINELKKVDITQRGLRLMESEKRENEKSMALRGIKINAEVSTSKGASITLEIDLHDTNK